MNTCPSYLQPASRGPKRRRCQGNVFLVIHELIPNYSMPFRNGEYSQDLDTVNRTVVKVFVSQHKADKFAHDYFYKTLGLVDSGDSECGFYFIDEKGDCRTWEQHVYVECQRLEDD